MFTSVICVGVKGAIDAGGLKQVWDIAEQGGRIQFLDFRIDPSIRHTFWTQMIGGIFTFTSLYAVNQTQVRFRNSEILSIPDGFFKLILYFLKIWMNYLNWI